MSLTLAIGNSDCYSIPSLDPALDTIFVHVPVVEPFRTIGSDGIEEVQLLLGPLKTELASSQEVSQQIVICKKLG